MTAWDSGPFVSRRPRRRCTDWQKVAVYASLFLPSFALIAAVGLWLMWKWGFFGG